VLKLNPLVLLLLFFICYTIHYFGQWVKLILRTLNRLHQSSLPLLCQQMPL
jgi:hypothetical protein